MYRSLMLLIVALGATAFADTGSINGNGTSPRVDALLTKADRLYEEEEYERAYFIYARDLVPLGQKYAQYMVGYMHLVGAGVDRDLEQALAWYRLAAELDTPEFVTVYEQLREQLDEEALERSELLYRDLLKQYSHVALAFSQLKADLRELSVQTGSRLPGSSRPVIVVDPSNQGSQSGSRFYEAAERRFERNLAYLENRLGLSGLSRNPSSVDLNELEAAVDAYLESVD
jgi:tetratricopeptide (TPR) repeat protein